tara:strand:- start:161 stop:421 length:261 start_codon:yes stop_codon:yes gene_type:complete
MNKITAGDIIEYLRTRSWNNFILEEFIVVHCLEHSDGPDLFRAALKGKDELYHYLHQKMTDYLDAEYDCVERIIWPDGSIQVVSED